MGERQAAIVISGDTLADLPVFLAAAEAGSFSAAAVRLNQSRSAVGKTIARLEARLGTRLFHRTTRSLALTEDGQGFFDHCQHAMAALQAGQAMLDAGRRTVAGRLRVSMPVLFGRQCVAPILTRLAAAHPRLDLVLSFSDRIVDLMEDGFDLAIRDRLSGDGLTTRRVACHPMRVCASPAYLARAGTPTAVAELAQHPAILYGRGNRLLAWQFPQPRNEPTIATPAGRLRFDDLGAIHDAVVDGLGLAWLPYWLIRNAVAAGTLVTLLDHVPAHVFDTYAVWLQAPQLPLRLRLAIDALASELPRVTALPE